MSAEIVCVMCGNHFDPETHTSCPGCPMQKGCQLTCCPACGYETIDVNKSFVYRWTTRLRKGWRKHNKHERGNLPAHLSMENLSMTLADIRPGQEIQVTGFLPQLPNHTQVRLKAYGMVPGVSLTVIQQSPVTIVSIEHLELALENDLARSVAVKNIL